MIHNCRVKISNDPQNWQSSLDSSNKVILPLFLFSFLLRSPRSEYALGCNPGVKPKRKYYYSVIVVVLVEISEVVVVAVVVVCQNANATNSIKWT